MQEGEVYRLLDNHSCVWHWRKAGIRPMTMLCGSGDVLYYVDATVSDTDTFCEKCELLYVLEAFND